MSAWDGNGTVPVKVSSQTAAVWPAPQESTPRPVRVQPARIRPRNLAARVRQASAAAKAAAHSPRLEMVFETSGPPAPVLSTTAKLATTAPTTRQSRAQRRASPGDGCRAAEG